MRINIVYLCQFSFFFAENTVLYQTNMLAFNRKIYQLIGINEVNIVYKLKKVNNQTLLFSRLTKGSDKIYKC